jgi:hypothetical protein
MNGTMSRFTSAHDLAEYVRRSGDTHWFDRDTMRFFNTRLSSTYYGNGVFVSSERSPSGVRRYTVRVLRVSEGRYTVQSVSGFGAYASLAGASNAARRASREFSTRSSEYVNVFEMELIRRAANVRDTDGF